MYGFAVIEVINLLEQLSNIDEIDCQADCCICTCIFVRLFHKKIGCYITELDFIKII